MPGLLARLDPRARDVRVTRARLALLGGALLAVALAFFVARPAPTAGPALRDFESYYAAGATWRYEGDPYGRDVWRVEKDVPGVARTRDELLPFVGPPFGLPLWSALARLSWNEATALWATTLALATAALAVATLRLAGPAVGAADVVAVAVVAAGFGPLTSGIALGQVAVLACAAIALVPFALGPRRVALAFVAALVAALQPNLAIVLAARLGSRRAGIAFVCAALVALGASALALGGPDGLPRYRDVLAAQANAERFIAIQTTPAAIARAFGAAPDAARTLGLAIAALAVVLVVVQCARRRDAPDARLALACTAVPFAFAFAHEHDFAIVFFPALLTVRRARGRVWTMAAVGTLVVGTDWLGLAQRPSGVAETALLTLGAALGLAALAPEPLRPRHAVPALVALGVALAGPFAAANVLPTWPDGLSATFHVPATMPAPDVWAREQRASGVARLDPATALLRLFSFAGCALVWFAASRTLGAAGFSSAGPNSGASSTPRRRPVAIYPSSRETP